METEKATLDKDLPHEFTPKGLICECGRNKQHELHEAAAREIASDTAFIRELGT